jgi:hypothetical protein
MPIVLSKTTTKISLRRLLKLNSSASTFTLNRSAPFLLRNYSIGSPGTPTATPPTATSDNKSVNKSSNVTFPLATKVVICGGGLFGTSIAYHLGQLGYKDVVLVTRDRIGSGSSRFSTGLVECIKVSTTETLFSKYTANLYQKLQNEGHDLSMFQSFFLSSLIEF